jgi:hypothetical protein
MVVVSSTAMEVCHRSWAFHHSKLSLDSQDIQMHHATRLAQKRETRPTTQRAAMVDSAKHIAKKAKKKVTILHIHS